MSDYSRHTLYLDESGTSSQTEVVCVAGFVSSDEQWNRFAQNWLGTLREYGIPAFRAVDFAQSKKVFAKWEKHKIDNALRFERETFFRKLLGHIRVRVRRSFASSVFMDEYNDIDREYVLHEAIAPRTFCARACIIRCLAWANKYAVPRSSIRFVIESGGEKSGELIRQVAEKEGITLEQCGKNEDGGVALQSADLFAYEYFQANRRLKWGERRFANLRFPFRWLDEMPKDDSDWSILDAVDFRKSVGSKLAQRQ
jgi:hypothetical protein